ncbi:MAG: Fic family protein [Eubacterium sp.]|nr:Fic family protein [Eubacterium sp.]
MKYVTLKKLWYKDRETYQEELTLRKDGMYSTYFPIDIHNNPAFMVTLPTLLNDISLIYKDSKKLESKIRLLPAVAKDKYLESCLFEEIMLTNDIEGIRSTRREVMAAYEQLKSSRNKEKLLRFSGLINKYAKLASREYVALNSSGDIRNLYDEIILPEIDKKDIPDGNIFRSGPVDIVTPAQKVKHQGLNGEDTIIKAMNSTLSILNDEDIPSLIKIAAIHYFIGYIHPFYDGNGRLDRFISSYLLSQELSPMIAYRLSYIIKANQKKYYDAFDECNDIKNAGDITPFILMFMDLVKQSLKHVLEVTENGIHQIDHYLKLLEKFDFSESQRELVFYFIQSTLFTDDPFTLSTLSALIKKSSLTTHRYLDTLIEKGIPIIKSKNGKKYEFTFDLDRFEALSLE